VVSVGSGIQMVTGSIPSIPIDVVMYLGFAWLIIMGCGFDDWVYWHFFTIMINYDSSQSMTVYNSLHSLLGYECILFYCDEWWMTNHCSHTELPWITNYDSHLTNALLIYEWTLFYNFGRTDKRVSSQTVTCYSPVVTGMSLLIFAAETCVNP
jgi:hypothetical protein